MGCCGVSLFCALVTLNHRMSKMVNVADAAVLADGVQLRLIMVNGTLSFVMISDTTIESINGSKWKVRTKVDGRIVILQFDFNQNEDNKYFGHTKELIDKELCLAAVNPNVHKIEF